jgi:hypothetical protein
VRQVPRRLNTAYAAQQSVKQHLSAKQGERWAK